MQRNGNAALVGQSGHTVTGVHRETTYGFVVDPNKTPKVFDKKLRLRSDSMRFRMNDGHDSVSVCRLVDIFSRESRRERTKRRSLTFVVRLNKNSNRT